MIKMMYRSSEFTKQPRGRFELNLDSASGIQWKTEDYNPIMEFVLNNQRMLVDEPLQLRKTKMNQESEFKRWGNEKHLKFYTDNIHDVIQVNFYRDVDRNGFVARELIGSEIVDISALVLTSFPNATCQYENKYTINLRRVHKNLIGEIKILLNYLPIMSVKTKVPE